LRAIYAVGGATVVALFGFLGGSPASIWSAPSPSASIHTETTSAVSPTAVSGAAQPLTVLLMGDSYTAGNGARDDAGAPAYYGPEHCMRSANTWGEQYARIMENNGYAITLLNRACSAATTKTILNDRYMKDTRVISYPEPELADARRDDHFYVDWASSHSRCAPAPATEEYFVSTVNRVAPPDGAANVTVACERWLPAQSAALNRDVDLVLMTVGGNDARFPDIVRECLIVAEVGACQEAVDTARQYVRDDYADDLLTVFGDISRTTEGHAKVGYAAYPGLEVSRDLRVTSVGTSGVSVYPVAQELAALAQEGLAAQRSAVSQANAQFGDGFVTLMDEVPELFRGHEPDARPGFANPGRWMYEFLETTERDEWYHLRPEGQSRFARYAATFGDFGASDNNGRARDLALVIDQSDGSRSASESALADSRLWRGAQVSVVEQRIADDGVHFERRVIASAGDPADVLTALRATSTVPWLPARSVRLQARWNATVQSVFVGDAAFAVPDDVQLWSGGDDGRPVFVDSRHVDVSHQSSQLPSTVRESLAAALTDTATAPHAWAGGPYVTAGTELHLTARGSFGSGDLTYAWDLNGDGIFETDAPDAHLQADPGEVKQGWVSVRVATPGGTVSVASAWVSAVPQGADASTPCINADGGGVAHSQSGQRGCWPDLTAPAGPDSEGIPVDPAPSVSIAGNAGIHATDAVAAMNDDGRMLAALTLLPLYVEERVVTSSGARVRRSSLPGQDGRGRPRELVRREKALRGLLVDSRAAR